jgi:hypothetical protein
MKTRSDAGSIKVPRKICGVCGKEFYAPPSRIRRSSKEIVCSKKCMGELARGKGNHNWKEKIKKNCHNCKKEYFVFPSFASTSKFCSKKCMREFKIKNKKIVVKAKDSPNWRVHSWRGGDIETICRSCGKVFMAKRAAANKGQAKFCSHICWGREMVHIMGNRLHTSARGGKREDLNNMYFRSAWEANYARYLNWLISVGEIKSWKFEPDTFEFKEIHRGHRFYIPDFKIFNNDGSYEYHEVKGYMDAASRVKLNRMAKYYPLEKVVLIDKDQYISISRQVKNFIPNWEMGKRY